MKDAISYRRVSTREQGRSGLGLAAQRHDIETFGAREEFSIRSWYQDIQTGAGKDALLLRPAVPSDRVEARSPVAQRPLHHRAHGAHGALHRGGTGSRL
jgi:Resolvase, N terminal domain